jgi:hypothetical protein
MVVMGSRIANTASLHIAKPNRHHLTEVEILDLLADDYQGPTEACSVHFGGGR